MQILAFKHILCGDFGRGNREKEPTKQWSSVGYSGSREGVWRRRQVLHHFLSSKPLWTRKLQIRAVFSCPGLSTSFRACLFQNRIPIGYHYLSSKSWNWYPIFRVTIFSPVFPVFIHNPPDCPQWKSWKNFSRRVEKLKTGILLVSYHCQWSILSSKSIFF